MLPVGLYEWKTTNVHPILTINCFKVTVHVGTDQNSEIEIK